MRITVQLIWKTKLISGLGRGTNPPTLQPNGNDGNFWIRSGLAARFLEGSWALLKSAQRLDSYFSTLIFVWQFTWQHHFEVTVYSIHSSWLPGILAGAETEVKTSNFVSPNPPKKKTHRISVGKKIQHVDPGSWILLRCSEYQKNFRSQKLNFWPLRGPNPKER